MTWAFTPRLVPIHFRCFLSSRGLFADRFHLVGDSEWGRFVKWSSAWQFWIAHTMSSAINPHLQTLHRNLLPGFFEFVRGGRAWLLPDVTMYGGFP